MSDKTISNGTAHKLPKDMRKAIAGDKRVLMAWESLTPLARNEWICWTTSVKKSETRAEHIQRMKGKLKEGVRRPCCWIGCIHRKDKAISPSIRAVLAKRSSNKKSS